MADGLEVDLRRARVVRRDGEEVHLTPTEFDLLRALARNRGRLMTYRELLSTVWGPATARTPGPARATSPTCGARSSRPGGPRYVKTDPGVGYRFAA